GPSVFVRYLVDDNFGPEPFADYFGGMPRNAGLVLKVVPDDIMRGLELRKGTTDIVINNLTPDTAHQLETGDGLKMVKAPGVDYQYLGLNMIDPALRDVRV